MNAPRLLSRVMLLLAFALLVSACQSEEPLPTVEVEQKVFQLRVTAEGTLKAARATEVAAPSQVKSSMRLAWLATDGTQVAEGDLIARFDASVMEERLEEGQVDLRSRNLEVQKTQAQGDLKQLEIATDLRLAELDLDHAQQFQKTENEFYSRHEVIESKLDETLAAERKKHAQEAEQQQRILNQTELDLLKIEERKAQLMIDQAREGLDALEVRAPHDGLLTLARDRQGEPLRVGAQMWRGQKIAEIPDLAKMEAEVFVLEADAGGLAADKPALVVVESDPGRVHQGHIQRVEAVAKPRNWMSPVQYFGVTLELENTDPEVMKPGQRVRATLLLEDLPEALVIPRQTVLQEGSGAKVFVAQGSGFVPREVEIGASSMGLIVVTSGLEAGERIALRPPTTDSSEDRAGSTDSAGSGPPALGVSGGSR